MRERFGTVYRKLYTVNCKLYTVYRKLYSVYRKLYSVYRKLYTVYRKLYTVYRTLYSVYRKLYTVYCSVLSVVEGNVVIIMFAGEKTFWKRPIRMQGLWIPAYLIYIYIWEDLPWWLSHQKIGNFAPLYVYFGDYSTTFEVF